MFAKLLTIVVVAGLTASSLLVNRQRRIDTAHEMSVLHQRLVQHRQAIWRLRSEIAERCRPDQVRVVMDRLDDAWIPIPAEPLPPLYRSESPRPAMQVATEEADAAVDLGG